MKKLNLTFKSNSIKYYTQIILVFFFLFSVSIYYSCSSDDTTVSNNNPPPTYYLVDSFNGTVHNLPDTARTLKAIITQDSFLFVAGTATIGPDSIMNISSLATPPASYLPPISLFTLPLGTGNISISDPGANGNFLIVYTYNSGAAAFNGIISRANTPTLFFPAAGNFYVEYFYCDRNTNLTGTATRIVGSDTTKNNVSLVLGTGYNKITNRITTLRANYLESDIFSGEPDGASWYYVAYDPGFRGRAPWK